MGRMSCKRGCRQPGRMQFRMYRDNAGSVVIVDVQDPEPGPYVPVRSEGYHLIPRSVGFYPSPPSLPTGCRRKIHLLINNAQQSAPRRARKMMGAGGPLAVNRDHPAYNSIVLQIDTTPPPLLSEMLGQQLWDTV